MPFSPPRGAGARAVWPNGRYLGRCCSDQPHKRQWTIVQQIEESPNIKARQLADALTLRAAADETLHQQPDHNSVQNMPHKMGTHRDSGTQVQICSPEPQ